MERIIKEVIIFISIMNPREYQQHIRRLEMEEFPELAEDDYSIESISHCGNILFTPNHQFTPSHPLMTEEIVVDLQTSEKSLLSIGCGPAYLERLLTSRLGVKPKQITLGDISQDHVPSGFDFHQFDMYGDWPEIQKPFDYIIFPESVLINVRFNEDSEKKEGLYHIVANSLDRLKPIGEIRMNGHCQLRENVSSVTDRISQHYPNAKLIYHDNELLSVTRGK